jgi:signal transduction histidine kinase
MQAHKRVVIHDQQPLLTAGLIDGAVNRGVLALAATSFGLQLWAIAQILQGRGQPATIADHVFFAAVALFWLNLGLLVFAQRGGGLAGRMFLLCSAFGSIFVAFGTLYGVSRPDAFLFSGGLLVFPPLLLLFVRYVSGHRQWRPHDLVFLVPPAVLLWPGAESLAGGSVTVGWQVAMAAVGLYLVGSVLQAYRDLCIATNPAEAAQERALVFGLIAGTVPGIILFVFPLVGRGHLLTATAYTWIPPIILLFLLAMSYAALLFEFAEAELIVRRGVVYGAITLVIMTMYGLLGVILGASRASIFNPGGGIGFVLVTVGVGAAFIPVRRFAHRQVDWLLYGQRTDRWQLLQDLSARLSIVMQPADLAEVLVHDIAKALHLRGAFLLWRQPDGGFAITHRFQIAGASARRQVPDDISLTSGAVLAALGDPPCWLSISHAKPLTEGRRETVPDEYQALDGVRSALTIPLTARSGLQVILCLQPKLAHDAFDADDLELLTPVMRQATAALDTSFLFTRLEEKVAELRLAYRRIAREQETERARLARELHDGTAQEVAGLITLAAVVDRQLQGEEPAARDSLDRLRLRAQETYQGVRRASHALRPPTLDDFGLVPTLARFLQEFEEASGMRIAAQTGDIGDLGPEIELALFRVVQECLENARKHSGASGVELELRRDDGHVSLVIADHGRGLPAEPGGGIGLAGMRERIEAIGGELRVSSRAGEGVQVRAVVPVAEPEHD